ncbi:hypothetical protein B9Z19DRAFT_1189126, partial [Tuber borchii]
FSSFFFLKKKKKKKHPTKSPHSPIPQCDRSLLPKISSHTTSFSSTCLPRAERKQAHTSPPTPTHHAKPSTQ